MPKLKIRDIAVLANYDDTPRRLYGEAPDKDDGYTGPTPEERADTVTRLQSSIFELMDNAEQTHNEHLQNTTDPGEADHYITRLSTHEFFFYTKAPLTLEEFERLQEQILQKATTLPNGVQLALASFAVEIPGQGVMNVTPFIMCGDLADAKFIIKNNTSTIDVSYQDNNGVTKTPLDMGNYTDNTQGLTLMGKTYPLTLNNIVPCITPSGEPFLTAVDICIDHLRDVSRENLDKITKEQPERLSQPISQIVLSNTVELTTYACIGEVMHNDPRQSKPMFEKVGIETSNELELPFGTEKPAIHTLMPVEHQTLEQGLLDNQSKISTILNEKKKKCLENITESESISAKLLQLEIIATRHGESEILAQIKDLEEHHRKIITNSQTFLQKIEEFNDLIILLNRFQLSEDDKMLQVYINKQIVDFCKENQPHLISSVLTSMQHDIACLKEIENYLQNYADNRMLVSDVLEDKMLNIQARYCSTSSIHARLSLSNVIRRALETELQQKLENLKKLIPGKTGKNLAIELQSKFIWTNNLKDSEQVIKDANNLCRNHQLINYLVRILSNYHTSADNIFAIGMQKKANKINDALENMSIDDFCNLHKLDDNHPLFEALASRRYLGGIVSRTTEGKIDPNKAATIFKNFKRQVQKVNDNIQPDTEVSKDKSTSNKLK